MLASTGLANELLAPQLYARILHIREFKSNTSHELQKRKKARPFDMLGLLASKKVRTLGCGMLNRDRDSAKKTQRGQQFCNQNYIQHYESMPPALYPCPGYTGSLTSNGFAARAQSNRTKY